MIKPITTDPIRDFYYLFGSKDGNLRGVEIKQKAETVAREFNLPEDAVLAMPVERIETCFYFFEVVSKMRELFRSAIISDTENFSGEKSSSSEIEEQIQNDYKFLEAITDNVN